MKGHIFSMTLLGFGSAANALAMLAYPEWFLYGMLTSVVMPFAGAMVAMFDAAAGERHE